MTRVLVVGTDAAVQAAMTARVYAALGDLDTTWATLARLSAIATGEVLYRDVEAVGWHSYDHVGGLGYLGDLVRLRDSGVEVRTETGRDQHRRGRCGHRRGTSALSPFGRIMTSRPSWSGRTGTEWGCGESSGDGRRRVRRGGPGHRVRVTSGTGRGNWHPRHAQSHREQRASAGERGPTAASPGADSSSAPPSSIPAPSTTKPVTKLHMDVPDEMPTDISCPVGGGYCLMLTDSGNVWEYQSGTWDNIFTADETLGIGKAVSCSVPRSCMIVYSHRVQFYDGTEAVSQALPADVSGAVGGCPGVEECVLGFGMNKVSHASSGGISAPQSLNTDPLYQADVESVQCAGAETTLCIALTSDGTAYTSAAGGWSSGTHLAPGQASNTDPTFGSNGVADCPSVKWCLAVDRFGEVFTLSNGHWSKSARLTGPGYPAAVDCRAVNDCVAVGIAPPTTEIGNVGVVWTMSGGSWSAGRIVDHQGVLNVVGCPSKTGPCLTVDDEGNVLKVG